MDHIFCKNSYSLKYQEQNGIVLIGFDAVESELEIFIPRLGVGEKVLSFSLVLCGEPTIENPRAFKMIKFIRNKHI